MYELNDMVKVMIWWKVTKIETLNRFFFLRNSESIDNEDRPLNVRHQSNADFEVVGISTASESYIEQIKS